MKKNFNKSLSFILAVLMAVSCFSVSGFAADYGVHNGHNVKVTEAVPAKQCTDGKTEGIICLDCNAVIKESYTIEAPHRFSDWVAEKTTDCTTGYKKTRTCQFAGCTKKEEVTVTEHSWADAANGGWTWVNGAVADCTKGGTKIRVCSVCGTEETKEVAKQNHTWVEKKDSADRTCENEGAISYYVCSRCGEVDPDRDGSSLGQLPHEDNDGDGYCDNGCEGFISEDGSICQCPCHQKSGFLSKIYKVVLFIFRLFKIGQKCGCGVDHYSAD